MLRAVVGVVVLAGLAGVGYYWYASHSAANKNIAAGPNITAENTAPAAPEPASPALNPLPWPALPALPLPPKVETPPAPPVQPTPKAKRTHVVKAGESLSTISRHYYGTPDRYGKIAAANNLHDREMLRVGQVLVIPDLTHAPSVPAVSNENNNNEEPAQSTAVTPDFEPQPPTLNTIQKRTETISKK